MFPVVSASTFGRINMTKKPTSKRSTPTIQTNNGNKNTNPKRPQQKKGN
jgi:hypothetical protein